MNYENVVVKMTAYLTILNHSLEQIPV